MDREKSITKKVLKKSVFETLDKKSKPYDYMVLFGLGDYIVKANELEPHNYRLVTDAFHSYARRNKNVDMEKRFREAIYVEIGVATDFEYIERMKRVFNVLYYELKKEAGITAAFNVDFDKIIRELAKRSAEGLKFNTRVFSLDEQIEKLSVKVSELKAVLKKRQDRIRKIKSLFGGHVGNY